MPNQLSGTRPEPMPRDHSERKTRPAMHRERSTMLALEGGRHGNDGERNSRRPKGCYGRTAMTTMPTQTSRQNEKIENGNKKANSSDYSSRAAASLVSGQQAHLVE